MMTREEFAAQVADAYEHLYDLVYLRTHPLLDRLAPASAGPAKRRARVLHHILLEAISELDPGPQAPACAQEYRRHRLLVLRYVKGLPPQAVADQLILSLRHYFRVQSAALDDVTTILWERHQQGAPACPAAEPAEEDVALSRLELLRLEAARTVQADRFARLSDVVQGVLPLLAEMLRQRRLEVRLQLADALPGALVDQSLLRQMLLGLLGYLIAGAEQGEVVLAAQVEGTAVCLRLAVEPPEAVRLPLPADNEERLSALAEMAAIISAQILPLHAGPRITGFELRLPLAERTVLVVDDNEDVLELFRSYLSPHHYRVVTGRVARAAWEQARRIQPYAITLDLMMPGQDGWDVLQSLLNHPETRHIPVIVCSVLKQKELALSLGAAAFLAKPITEQALLSALEALERSPGL